jgi:hypothetical protein
METGREHSRCDAVHKEVAVVVEGVFVDLLIKEDFQTATGVKLECSKTHELIPFSGLVAKFGIEHPPIPRR